VTAPDATGELRVTVEVDYGQWYLFDPDADATWLGDLVDTDPVTWAELWERRCASSGSAVFVCANKHDGPTEILLQSVADAPDLDEAADHVVECSLHLPIRRLAVSGWETTIIGGVLTIPSEPVRVRIAWHGLTIGEETGDESAERYEVTVFPGAAGPVEVLRWWPTWELPPSETVTEPDESTTERGLRLYRGSRAVEERQAMESIMLAFWPPHPQLPEGSVGGLLRDPRDGSRWAHGRGQGSHEFLSELTPDEADTLEAQGFPIVITYATDADGRIWTSGQMPIERSPCLNLVPGPQFEAVRGFVGDDRISVVDLPPGWNRLYRLARDGRGGHVPVDAVDDSDDGHYQRWPDDGPGPPGPPG
jgi:hypothetical protein